MSDQEVRHLLERERACLIRAAGLRQEAKRYEAEATRCRQAAWQLQRSKWSRAPIASASASAAQFQDDCMQSAKTILQSVKL